MAGIQEREDGSQQPWRVTCVRFRMIHLKAEVTAFLSGLACETAGVNDDIKDFSWRNWKVGVAINWWTRFEEE